MGDKAISGHELSEISPNTGLLNSENASVNTHDDTAGDAYGDITNAKKSSTQSQIKLREIVRQFRLQSASSILSRCMGSRWNADTERRKVAIHQNRAIAALHSLLHIAPLTGAITLLALQWTNYWVSSRDEDSSTLQFVAKLHELTMQASIAEVLLFLIRTGLVDGLLPFGTLSGAIQPTQLSFLWSLDYLSVFRSPAFRGWKKVVFAVALPLLIALTALVGPASAVLMIPRTGSPRIISDWTFWADETDDASYPTGNLSATRFDLDLQELNTSLWYSDQKESSFVREASTGRDGYIGSNTISHFSGFETKKRLLRYSHQDGFMLGDIPLTEANVTIPTEVISSRRIGFAGLNTTESVVAAYPFVGVQCWYSVYPVTNSNNWYYPYPFTSSLPDLRTLISLVSDSAELTTSTYNRDANYSMINFSPVWISSLEPLAHPLLVVFFSAVTSGKWNGTTLVKPDLLLSMIGDDNVEVSARTCAVSASWNSGEIQTTTNEGNTLVATTSSSPTQQSEPQEITLDVTGADEMHTAKFHSILQGLGYNPSGYNLGFPGILAAALAIWIAKVPMSESMIDEQGSVKEPFTLELPPDKDPKDYTPYRFIITEHGYGYGTRSTAVYLSMAVFILYCLIAIAYMLYTLLVGAASTAWSSGTELIALALQSKKPDHIEHTGIGIDSVKTLSDSVGIRVNKDNEVELVFARDRDFNTRGLRKLERDKEY